jgi:hypothetical protein
MNSNDSDRITELPKSSGRTNRRGFTASLQVNNVTAAIAREESIGK